jgi:hypothetical protein
MPRPGVDIDIVEEYTQGQANLDPSQAFMIGTAQRGPANVPTLIQSMNDFRTTFGDRLVAEPWLYDAATGFFGQEGETLYVTRYNGGAAVAAAGDLGTMLHVTAWGPGVWGNGVEVSTVTPTGAAEAALGAAVIEVVIGDELVERSPSMTDFAKVIDWAVKHSKYVRFGPFTGASPATELAAGQTVTLAGGVDDNVWDSAGVVVALAALPYDLGPGQVSAPGRTDLDTMIAISEHLALSDRVAVVELPSSDNPLDLSNSIQQLWDLPAAQFMLAIGNTVEYPYDVPPEIIRPPASGIQSGMIARVDKQNDPSLAAAGDDGIVNLALGITYDPDDITREDLNALGIGLYKVKYGQVRMYGYRTAAGPGLRDNWTFFQESRVIMMIAHEANAFLEAYVLKTVDGRGLMFQKMFTGLTGICDRYWRDNALYGETATEAFKVDTISPNTTDTIKRGEVHATLRLKTSKQAEWVQLNLMKVRLDRAL